MFLAFNAPHDPLQAPEDEVAKYLGRGDLNKAVSTLYAMISIMDDGIGKVVEALRSTNQLENTIILFTSDNGAYLGANREYYPSQGFQSLSINRYNGSYRGMKQDVLEGGIRVPAILSWPQKISPRKCDDMITGIDWLPTLLGLSNIQVAASTKFDGMDVSAQLLSKKTLLKNESYWQFNRLEPEMYSNGAMRMGKWKIYWPFIPETKSKPMEDNVWYRGMYYLPPFETDIDTKPVDRFISKPYEVELYDLLTDPSESKNVAKENPKVVEQMVNAYTKWFNDVNATRLALPDAWKGKNIIKNRN